MLIVFDLDGTLALNEHRQHYVQRPPGQKKDWDGFFRACGGDEPNTALIAVLEALAEVGHDIEIWSGRSESVLDETLAWLDQHDLAHIPIRMRPVDDHTPDTELKRRWLHEAPRRPHLIFDDRASVVAMWREEGIPCYQVAPGDF